MAHSSQRGQAIIISDHFFADLLCDSYHGGLAIGARATPWTMQSDGIYITVRARVARDLWQRKRTHTLQLSHFSRDSPDF